MPPVELGVYLLDYLHELGFCQTTGMGVQPLSFTEIDHWLRATSLALTPWEVNALRSLSVDYVVQLRRSEEPLEPAPYGGGDLEKKREAVTDFFHRLKKQEQR